MKEIKNRTPKEIIKLGMAHFAAQLNLPLESKNTLEELLSRVVYLAWAQGRVTSPSQLDEHNYPFYRRRYIVETKTVYRSGFEFHLVLVDLATETRQIFSMEEKTELYSLVQDLNYKGGYFPYNFAYEEMEEL
jgi:hypothetical protein